MGRRHIQEFTWHSIKLKDKFKRVVSYVMNFNRSAFELSFLKDIEKFKDSWKYEILQPWQAPATTKQAYIGD